MGNADIWYGFVLGLVGSAVGALIAHFLSKSRRDEEDFKKAASEFKCTFLPEIIYLRHNANVGRGGSTDDLGEYLRAAYLRHLEAITIFRHSLNKNKRDLIDAAWQEYCHHPKNNGELCFEQYSNRSPKDGIKDLSHLKSLALKRIEKLLELAQ